MKKNLALLFLLFACVSCANKSLEQNHWFFGTWVADADKTKSLYGDKASGAIAAYDNKTISINKKEIVVTAIYPKLSKSSYKDVSENNDKFLITSDLGNYEIGRDAMGLYFLTQIVPLKVSAGSELTSHDQLLKAIKTAEKGAPQVYKVYMKHIEG